jgi:hypothetical protein
VEHRHEQRIACELHVELFRAGISIGKATTLNISNEGVNVQTDAPLKRNEIIDIVFLDDVTIPGWPGSERVMVAYVNDGHAGLWFAKPGRK